MTGFCAGNEFAMGSNIGMLRHLPKENVPLVLGQRMSRIGGRHRWSTLFVGDQFRLRYGAVPQTRLFDYGRNGV